MNKGKYLCVNIPKLMRPVDDYKKPVEWFRK